MVRRAEHSMGDGPKPPFVEGRIVKAARFDANWRSECMKAAKAQKSGRKRAYSDFTRSADRGMGC